MKYIPSPIIIIVLKYIHNIYYAPPNHFTYTALYGKIIFFKASVTLRNHGTVYVPRFFVNHVA